MRLSLSGFSIRLLSRIPSSHILRPVDVVCLSQHFSFYRALALFYNPHLRMLTFILFALLFKGSSPWWEVQTSGLDTNLRGVSVSDASDGKHRYVVWASGSNG